jgi:hypothetical protein
MSVARRTMTCGLMRRLTGAVVLDSLGVRATGRILDRR